MLLILIAVILALLMLLPIFVRADLHGGERLLLRFRLSGAGLSRAWLLELISTPEGHRILIHGRDGASRSISADEARSPAAETYFRTFMKEKRIRRFLLRHIHVQQLDAQLRLHTGNAAATALFTGAMQTALPLLPDQWRRVLRLRILPDFLQDHSLLQARCIFSVRPGILFITAGLVLAAQAAQTINREAYQLWNTPSEN